MGNPRVERILEGTNPNRLKMGEHPSCTIKFNRTRGTIYESGYDSQRKDSPDTLSVFLMYDTKNLCPIGALVDPNSANRTNGLIHMLRQVEDYRSRVSKGVVAEL